VSEVGKFPGAGDSDFGLDAAAVFVVDQFEEEEMKENNEQGECGPEDGRQPSKMIAVLVQRQHVVLVSRSFSDFFDVDRVFQILHVLLIGSDVEDGRGRIRQFHRKLGLNGTELNGGVQTSAVAGVIILIAAIQRQIEGGFVGVFHDGDGDVDVRPVAVVDAPVEEIAVQVARFRVELQVLVAEFPRPEAQQHGLHYTLGTHFHQLVATLTNNW